MSIGIVEQSQTSRERAIAEVLEELKRNADKARARAENFKKNADVAREAMRAAEAEAGRYQAEAWYWHTAIAAVEAASVRGVIWGV